MQILTYMCIYIYTYEFIFEYIERDLYTIVISEGESRNNM